MTTAELERTRRAIRLLSVTAQGTRPCWVCANRGHWHPVTGCDEDRCPCGRRALAPRAPAMASAWWA